MIKHNYIIKASGDFVLKFNLQILSYLMCVIIKFLTN